MVQVSRNNIAVAPSSEWNYDWTDCPRGSKMLLLTESGIAVLGAIGGYTTGYIAWAPLPDRRKPSMKQAPVAENTRPYTEAERAKGRGIYVASRASVPERGAMWRRLRAEGAPIISTWIDEDGEGATADFGDLWSRICSEVTGAKALILYAEPDDLPLKGAFIEVGMALAASIPVYAVLPGIRLEPRSMRPVGSWLAHPGVHIVDDVATAVSRAATEGPSE